MYVAQGDTISDFLEYVALKKKKCYIHPWKKNSEF